MSDAEGDEAERLISDLSYADSQHTSPTQLRMMEIGIQVGTPFKAKFVDASTGDNIPLVRPEDIEKSDDTVKFYTVFFLTTWTTSSPAMMP